MSTPLLENFTKKVKDLFKKKKYDLGNSIEVNGESGAAWWKTKVQLGSTVKPNLEAGTTIPDFGDVEVREDFTKKLLEVEVSKKKAIRNIDLSLVGKSNGCFEFEGVYQPDDSFYNVKVEGEYIPASGGSGRVCSTTVSGAVGDDELGLCVGAQLEIVDKSNVNSSPIGGYSLGFLYDPNPNAMFCLTFEPQDGGALQYSLSCYQKFSDKCQIAARAEGLADYSVNGVEAPIITFAGAWKLEDKNKLQAFCNSRKEFGLTYKVPVNDNINVQLGCASMVNKSTNALDTKFGYKLTIG